MREKMRFMCRSRSAGQTVGQSVRGSAGRFLSRTALACACACAAASLPGPLQAQQRDSIPGVALGLLYGATGSYQPPILFKPFEGRFGGEALAGQVEAIMARDLRYSDRYRVMDSIPPALLRGETDYTLLDRLGAVWMLSGQVEGGGDGYVLVLELHDVIGRQVRSQGRFQLPGPTDADFRMAVHRASDEVVQWTFGEPGMAASRIAFTMLQGGSKELYLIDSDGENLQRVTSHGDVVLSPAWSPDGRRIAYSSPHEGSNWEIFELDLVTRRTRKIQPLRDGAFITPAYHPDGETLAFAVQGGTRSGVFTYNLARDCCLRNLTESARNDLSPTYSPDGHWLAFNSNRFGDQVPQIFVMPAEGGTADLVSPYAYGQQGYYTSPDWSPFGNRVAFHGRVGRYGSFQILVARMGEQGRVTQLTWEGDNEDPSWAPDGRHLVFKGERRWGKGLFVVDAVTGNIRTVLAGVEVSVPQWSPALPAPSAASASASR